MEVNKKTIKDLSEEKRPMEKLINYGVANLSDKELLAILIGSGTRDHNAIELAQKILEEDFLDNQLLFASVEELMQIKGIGISKSTRIVAGLELGKRLGMIDRYNQISYNNPETVAEYFYSHYQQSSTEEFVVLILDSKKQVDCVRNHISRHDKLNDCSPKRSF